MSTGLIDIMKRASQDAEENAKPTDLRYGIVISDSPVSVKITNVFTIPSSMLVIPEHLTDYEIEITTSGYDWETDKEGDGGDGSVPPHSHKINQKEKKLKVHGALKVGDKVAVIRQRGGQSYYVLDRLPKE